MSGMLPQKKMHEVPKRHKNKLSIRIHEIFFIKRQPVYYLLLTRLLSHFTLSGKHDIKNPFPERIRKRISSMNSASRYFPGVTRECPDISAGCFNPIRLSSVGATSARMPSERVTWSLSSAT